MAKYQEKVLAFRIMRHEELPPAHKAAYIADGINPDNLWSLVWSFSDKEYAEKCLEQMKEEAASWQTYKLVEAQEEVIEREEMF